MCRLARRHRAAIATLVLTVLVALPASSAAIPAKVIAFDAPSASQVTIAGFRVTARSTYADAIAAYGKPTSCSNGSTPSAGAGVADWAKLGLTVYLGPPKTGTRRRPHACQHPATTLLRELDTTSKGWKTDAGLAVGMPQSRVAHFYPRALQVLPYSFVLAGAPTKLDAPWVYEDATAGKLALFGVALHRVRG